MLLFLTTNRAAVTSRANQQYWELFVGKWIRDLSIEDEDYHKDEI